MKKEAKFIKNNWDWLLLALAIFAGLFLRYHKLDEFYYNNDEVYDLSFASHNTPWGMFRDSLTRDGHPFLTNILLHLALKISTDRIFDVTIQSVMPAVLSIIAFFYTGRKFIGAPAGLMMALVVNFGYEIFILSQVLRGYTILILFLALSVFHLMKYLYEGKQKNLWYSYLLAFAATLTHYSGIIAAGGMAGAVAMHMLATRQKWKDIIIWVYANLLMAGLVAWYIFTQKSYQTAVFFYTPDPIPYNPAIWLKSLLGLLELFTLHLKPVAVIFLLLIIGGAFVMCRAGKWVIPLAVLGMLVLNTALALLHKYPFTAFRICIYLLPYFAVLAGYAIQEIYIYAVTFLRKDKKWLGNLLSGAAIFLLASSWAIYINKHESYRRYNVLYFVEGKAEYDEILDYVFKNAGPNDIIFAEGATANYLLYQVGIDNADKLDCDLFRIKYNGRDIYYNYVETWPRFESQDELRVFLTYLKKRIDPDTVKLWYIRIGWQSPLSFGRGFGWPGDNFTFIKEHAQNYKMLYNDGYMSAEAYAIDWQALRQFYHLDN